MTIVITAPTGQIGGQVVQGLLDRGEPVRVIARDPGRLSAAVRERVEVVEGSHGDPAVVDRAFAGAGAVFWLVPADPRAASVEAAYVGFSRPACAAFARHGVGRVVGVSALGRGTPMAGRAGYVTASLAVDDLIAATGVPYRALTMPSFMDNLVRQTAGLKSDGVFTGVLPGDHKAPACATRDIAAAAVRLLADGGWTGAGSLAVLGPEDLSFNDMAAIMTEVLGRPVRYQQVSGEAFKARMMGFGTSEAMAQGWLDMALAKADGLDNAEPRTPESSSPTSFRQWCADVLRPAVNG
ncbi:NAD(P)H-binding protein [Dactylosporangium sp. CA-092794]|uniref:NmrA family NAD(P)-binding protein n=1 Tax=Dactylosporangium sp. CA-092794 TaxID=3239929 RepID=UPI003D8C8379